MFSQLHHLQQHLLHTKSFPIRLVCARPRALPTATILASRFFTSIADDSENDDNGGCLNDENEGDDEEEELWNVQDESGSHITDNNNNYVYQCNHTNPNIFKPTVPPDFIVTRNPLPPDLARAVQEHTSHVNLWIPPAQDRHMVRHSHLDRRKPKNKGQKTPTKLRNRRGDLNLTPFVLLGAHRRIVDRLERLQRQQPPSSSSLSSLAQQFLETSIPFRWFEQMVPALANIPNNNSSTMDFKATQENPKQRRTLMGAYPNRTPRYYILEEVEAMLMEPLVHSHLDPHSYALRGHDPYQVSFVDEALKLALAEQHPKTPFMEFLTWNLAGNKLLLPMEDQQLKVVCNMLRPYMPQYVIDRLQSMWKMHKTVGKKGYKYWYLDLNKHPAAAENATGGSFASMTSLPAMLTDLMLMPLDLGDAVGAHPVWRMYQPQMSTTTTTNESCIVRYHRVGPAIVVSYLGHVKGRDKLIKQVNMFLKSNLALDKKLVEDPEYFKILKGKEVLGTNKKR